MLFFLFLIIVSLPPVILINLAQPGSKSPEQFYANLWISFPIFLILILYSEREGHKKNLKALEELLPENPKEKGAS